MGEMLGTVLDRLQTLLGKSFVLAGLFPVCLAVAASALLAYAIEPETPFLIEDLGRLDTWHQLLAIGLAIIAVAFIGFVLWMLNPAIRSVLEGAFPGATWFQAAEDDRCHRLNHRINDLSPDYVYYRGLAQPGDPIGLWRATIRAARGLAPAGSGAGRAVDPALLETLHRIQQVQTQGRLIRFAEMESLLRDLTTELAAKSADELPALELQSETFRDLAKAAAARTISEYDGLRAERSRRFPRNSALLRPTRLGNLRAAHDDYILRRYGVNVESYLLAIQRFAAKDKSLGATIEDAKTRLDFSVAMVAVITFVTALWLVWLASVRGPILLFVAIFVGGPLLAWVFYRLCIINSYGLYAGIRAATEIYRFDLLKLLHYGLPADAVAERRLWADIAQAELGDANLAYKHD